MYVTKNNWRLLVLRISCSSTSAKVLWYFCKSTAVLLQEYSSTSAKVLNSFYYCDASVILTCYFIVTCVAP